MASEDDLTKVLNYTKQKIQHQIQSILRQLRRKNIIKNTSRKFPNILINKKVNGKEVTPFLNKLSTGNEDFRYYPNFFHQTGQGKTSDAEFTMDKFFMVYHKVLHIH